MKISINNLLREPLLHFLLIGAAIFIYYGQTREVADEAPNHIVVTSGQQEQLVANFRRTWMRTPTRDELKSLVENYVREEVFYREALAMGLDQNDPLVRQRMRQKLESALEDLSSQNVTDEALIAYLQENPDSFREEAKLSFRQVYLDPGIRDDLEADAKQLLARLNGGASPGSAGDPILMPSDYSLATQSEIARNFGERFARAAIELAPGDWTGPVYSAYGGHLLKVTERIEARQPELMEIRAQVEREYLAQKRNELKDLAYRKLRKGYDVSIEPLQVVQGSDSEVIAAVQAGQAE